MLRHEEAEKRLDKIKIKHWQDRAAKALGNLPGKLCEAGRAILGRDGENKPFRSWEKRQAAEEAAQKLLVKITPKERQRIFAVFFPRLAGHLEAAWQMIAQLPYEVEYDRKGFRAPGDVNIHTTTRWNWFDSVINELEGFDQDLAWFAAWAPYLGDGGGADSVGILLAAALEAGGPEGDAIFEILKESASGQHEIGRMGRHVSRALLVSSRPEGWEFMEKMLLAAQRQEGLRQVIMETIDEAHPQAFVRMLRLILDQNLIRFSSVIRAIDVWFGLQWTALTPAKLRETLQQVLRFLEDPSARTEALQSRSDETLYLALWAIAFEDAPAAIKPAAELCKDPMVERRFVAAHFLGQLELPEARSALVACLGDQDLRVALRALEALPGTDADDLFEPLQRLYDRLPAKQTALEPLVWPWNPVVADRREIADQMVGSLGKRSPSVLIPYVPFMGFSGKHWMINALTKKMTWDAPVRELLFSLVGDRDPYFREEALKALKKCTVEEAEAVRLEGFLSRKSSEMRRGVLGLLYKQNSDAALASVDRLLASKKAEVRLAGLELTRQLVEHKKALAACRERATNFAEERKPLTEQEQLQIDAILDVDRVVTTLEDALVLMNPADRSPVVAPRPREVGFLTPAAIACIKDLDKLIEKHGETPVTIQTHKGPREELLGNMDWSFPSPRPKVSLEEDKKRLPLLEIWEKWWEGRPNTTRDKDGLELLRASIWANVNEWEVSGWRSLGKRSKEMKAAVTALLENARVLNLEHDSIITDLLDWLLRLHPPQGATEFLLDAAETAFSLVPEADLLRSRNARNRDADWRNLDLFTRWCDKLEEHWRETRERWTPEQNQRFWNLVHWHDQPVSGASRYRPDIDVLLAAYEAGFANQTDILDHLLGPRDTEHWSGNFASLRQLTARPPNPILERRPEVRDLVQRCRERILEVELARGELPTAATGPAQALGCLEGLAVLERLLRKLAGKPFDRKTEEGDNKITVLSHLIQITHPLPTETSVVVAERIQAFVKQKLLTPERLLELAFLAPQWAQHIEAVLGWPGFQEGVLWFLAHMPSGRRGEDEEDFDDDEDMDEDIEEENTTNSDERTNAWTRQLRERTPLTQEQIREGAVDVSWFTRTHDAVGPRRWQLIAEASKYGCSDNSYKKAVLLGDVLRGKANKRDLIVNVKQKRLKDSVRMLGLLPMPVGEKREAELHARYKVLHEYRRYARGLSPLSREEAVRIAEIGLENLARTAGYPDPIRLEWAMEAHEIADLAKGPISAAFEGVTVTLSLDEQAQAQLVIQRGDRVLKSIPATVRKNPKIALLAERRADLKRQASRMRQSLEAAMVRGDAFTGTELRQLFEHPVLAPLLERLILLGEGIRGYPIAGGQGLSDYNGKIEPIKPDEQMRLAHPHDLLTAGDWSQWQHHCFQTERVQPFKQVFRELYLTTEQEKKDGAASHRYTGQQINPRQGLALFGSRGWRARDEVVKTFYDLGLTVEVNFRSGQFTPLEVEGWTIEDVVFRTRGDGQQIPLTEVPQRLFSEVMRDVDLVVSVAHVGGVDPEASASTVEMRAALLRETCSLLNISNYQIKSNHVIIEGRLGKYSVHLGSAVVHRQPGGSLCIVPVHSQHRGRLFLPFADDDPRTAEVLSKVLLLARDNEIQDPSILEQLRV
jgi:Family of unknown function (DUF5724)/Domain of unknown function (DUF4132)